jgi:uncharacterized tellurite resistance protein B-like protein
MSESLLKAILRLFAEVAHEDKVTHHERDQIKSFLEDHLSGSAVENYLKTFDQLLHDLPPRTANEAEDINRIRQLCSDVSPNLTQKQKVVIILELISIVQADGAISENEEKLLNEIGSSFKIDYPQLQVIKNFVLAKSEDEIDQEISCWCRQRRKKSK